MGSCEQAAGRRGRFAVVYGAPVAGTSFATWWLSIGLGWDRLPKTNWPKRSMHRLLEGALKALATALALRNLPQAPLDQTGDRPLTVCAKADEEERIDLGGERQSTGGCAALAKLLSAYGGPRRKHVKSIAARRMHFADQKSAHELM